MSTVDIWLRIRSLLFLGCQRSLWMAHSMNKNYAFLLIFMKGHFQRNQLECCKGQRWPFLYKKLSCSFYLQRTFWKILCVLFGIISISNGTLCIISISSFNWRPQAVYKTTPALFVYVICIPPLAALWYCCRYSQS